MIKNMFDKKGQEEMLGFALIIIIVAVILLVFLGISINKPQKDNVESYEVTNFVQSFLQYTTDCSDGRKLLDIQDLIFECQDKTTCSDGRETCEVLNTTLKEISSKSWIVGEDSPVKGYEMAILSGDEPLIYFKEGNITSNSKGSPQSFPYDIKVYFTAYY